MIFNTLLLSKLKRWFWETPFVPTSSKPVPTYQEESCVDETGDKTIRCIPLLPPHHELHDTPTAKVSAHDQEHADSGLWSPPN